MQLATNSLPIPWCHVCIWSGGLSQGPPPGSACRSGAGSRTGFSSPGLSCLHCAVIFISYQSWACMYICAWTCSMKAALHMHEWGAAFTRAGKCKKKTNMHHSVSRFAVMALSQTCKACDQRMTFTWRYQETPHACVNKLHSWKALPAHMTWHAWYVQDICAHAWSCMLNASETRKYGQSPFTPHSIV